MSIFPSLKGLRDVVMSHVGSDVTETSEPLIAKVLGRFDLILGYPNSNNVGNKTVPVKRNVSTNWGLLLKDTIDFLQSNKGLLKDVQSQAFRVDQDIRLLIEVIHSKAAKGGLDDEYVVGSSVLRSWLGGTFMFADHTLYFSWVADRAVHSAGHVAARRLGHPGKAHRSSAQEPI